METVDKHVLVVEDEGIIQLLFKTIFKKNNIENYNVIGSGLSAIQYFIDNKVDVVVMDIGLPDISGLDTIKIMKILCKYKLHTPKFIICTAYTSSQSSLDYISYSPFLLKKPFDENELIKMIRETDYGKVQI